jgi:hypothetical protein
MIFPPYFTDEENKEWYYFDDESGEYKLKDGAPGKAKENYNDYLKQTEYMKKHNLA